VAHEFGKERVLQAIDGCYGIVSWVANKLGCDWHTARKYIDRWEETRQAMQDEDDRALDFSEGKMIEQIKNGDGPMIRFHLMTKGKRRGYVERQEVTGQDGAPVAVNIYIPDNGREGQ